MRGVTLTANFFALIAIFQLTRLMRGVTYSNGKSRTWEETFQLTRLMRGVTLMVA